ncbi:MAG TPA: acyl-CoA desaturase [Burkholderiales bacterium]|nr:acyl-CoA desaturase [Burkholderiales bacterium]
MRTSNAGRLESRVDPLHRALFAELLRAGCFQPASTRCAAYAAFVIGGYSAVYGALLTAPGMPLRLAVIVAGAFFTMHGGFLAHEAGHGGITANRRLADFLGQLFHTLLTALCYSYFQHIHRRHHPHCNDRSRDPDMQSEFFSMYAESAAAKRGIGRWISRHQAVLIWVLVWLQGFTLKIDSLRFLAREPRSTRIDQLVVGVHYAMWLVPPAIVLGVGDALLNYGLITLLIGGYTGAAFVVNHIGTRVIEPQESVSLFRQELAVTRNLGDSRLADFFFGGVNNHIEHHLFPAMPTARLRIARHITREFCRRHGLAYREMSWLAAAREVTQHFRAMSAYVAS